MNTMSTGYVAIENVNAINEFRSKSLETEFLIAFCRPTGDKLHLKNTVSSEFWSMFVDCYERFRLPPTRYDEFRSL